MEVFKHQRQLPLGLATMGYSTTQFFAFAGLVIGFLMCAAGTCAPFWKHFEIEVNTLTRLFSITIPIIGNTKLVTIDTGLWWYCREYLDDKKCEMYDVKQDDSAKMWTYRIASVFSVLLSLLCALVGLCQICCSPGGQTIAHGVIAFIAGGAGVVTIAVFAASEDDDDYSLLMIETSYAWAFYVYVAGTAIICIVAFMLCFAAPDNSVGQVFPAAPAGGTIVVANSTQQMQSFAPQQYGFPNAMYTGPPKAMYTGPPNAMYTGSPNAMYTGSPKAMYTGPPNAMYTGSPKAMYTGPPNAMYTGSPKAMYTGPPNAMYAGPHQPTDLQQPPNHPFSAQPQINHENMSNHQTWD